MHTELFDDIYNNRVPHFNPIVCNGLATHLLKQAPDYINMVAECAANDFPKHMKLKYVGIEMATPEEAWAAMAAKKKNKRVYEMATSDIYMVKMHYSLDGKPLKPANLFLPIIRPGGILYLRGALYATLPVLADVALSVTPDTIYAPVQRSKLNFKRLIQRFMVNGVTHSESVIHGKIHQMTSDTKRTIKAVSTMGHYLFCKFGLRETFRKFAGVDIHIGTNEDELLNSLPADDWKIMSSCATRSPGLPKNVAYRQSNIKLAIRASDCNSLTMGLIAAFFYVVDLFPQRVIDEYLTNDESELRLWRILMGHVIFANHDSEGKLETGIITHLNSLDTYVDKLTKHQLSKGDVRVNTLYDLFAFVIENFATQTLQSQRTISSMYGKQLMVFRYVLSDITDNLFHMLFSLMKQNKPNFTQDEAENIIRRFIKPDLVMGMTSGHGEIRSIASASDNMILATTANIVQQDNSTGGVVKASKASSLDPSRYLDASQAEVAGHLNISKSEPSGRSRINPYVKLDDDFITIPKERFREIIAQAQARIQR
jgi:hypothetical protein